MFFFQDKNTKKRANFLKFSSHELLARDTKFTSRDAKLAKYSSEETISFTILLDTSIIIDYFYLKNVYDGCC